MPEPPLATASASAPGKASAASASAVNVVPPAWARLNPSGSGRTMSWNFWSSVNPPARSWSNTLRALDTASDSAARVRWSSSEERARV